jgi:hypothetical protein
MGARFAGSFTRRLPRSDQPPCGSSRPISPRRRKDSQPKLWWQSVWPLPRGPPVPGVAREQADGTSVLIRRFTSGCQSITQSLPPTTRSRTFCGGVGSECGDQGWIPSYATP